MIIAFHGDADGICSAALAGLWAKKAKRSVKFISPRSVSLPKLEGDEVIVLDIGKKVEIKAKKVVWIDHHEPFKPEQGWEYINPRINGENKPTSLLAYERFGGIAWIAYLGAVSDGFNPKMRIEHPPSIIRGLIPLVNSARAFGMQEEAVKLLMQNDLRKLVNSKLLDVYNAVEEEVNGIMKNKPERMGRVVLLEFESEHYLSNYVASRLRKKYGGIAVAANHYNGSVEVEIRTKEDVDLREIVKPWGGGHEKAAGATIPEEEWKNFKKKLLLLK